MPHGITPYISKESGETLDPRSYRMSKNVNHLGLVPRGHGLRVFHLPLHVVRHAKCQGMHSLGYPHDEPSGWPVAACLFVPDQLPTRDGTARPNAWERDFVESRQYFRTWNLLRLVLHVLHTRDSMPLPAQKPREAGGE